jgi:hypothetical protein
LGCEPENKLFLFLVMFFWPGRKVFLIWKEMETSKHPYLR